MKVLYLDIETSPNIAHVWGLFNQNISLSQLQEAGRTLCFAAKWRGSKAVLFASEFEHGREEMLRFAHELLTEADVVVHYNGKSFDMPTLNKEFVLAKMPPPAPYQQLDLLLIARKHFRFVSNKLAYVSKALGLAGKVGHAGHEMWVKCLAGDAKAWATMKQYNKQDVVLLEELHEILLPWITTHPNMRLNGGDPEGCPNCGGSDLRKEGFTYTLIGKYQRYQCRGCSAWSKSGKREDGTDIRGAA